MKELISEVLRIIGEVGKTFAIETIKYLTSLKNR